MNTDDELAQLLAEAREAARILTDSVPVTDETRLWAESLAGRIDRYRAERGWLDPAAAAALTEQSRREKQEFLDFLDSCFDPPCTPEEEAAAKAWAHNVVYGTESQLDPPLPRPTPPPQKDDR